MYIEISTGRNGYSAEQVSDEAITLEAFIEQLQAMIDEEGASPKTRVIMRSYGRGAVYEPVTNVEFTDTIEDEDKYI